MDLWSKTAGLFISFDPSTVGFADAATGWRWDCSTLCSCHCRLRQKCSLENARIKSCHSSKETPANENCCPNCSTIKFPEACNLFSRTLCTATCQWSSIYQANRPMPARLISWKQKCSKCQFPLFSPAFEVQVNQLVTATSRSWNSSELRYHAKAEREIAQLNTLF